MRNLCGFVKTLPNTKKAPKYKVYPLSINQLDESWLFMIREEAADYLVVTGSHADDFEGTIKECKQSRFIVAPLNHKNADALRSLVPFTAPKPVLSMDRSFGVGDRLGIATPGHIKAFEKYDAYPVFAQQSIRELNLTGRTYEDVLDAASFSVFREGFKRGFGADGDHLKKPEEIEYALKTGFTMITLDCSEHIKDVTIEKNVSLVDKVEINEEMTKRYLGQEFTVEGHTISFTEADMKQCVFIYQKAIEFAASMYEKYFDNGKSEANFEISIDETSTPTTVLQHYFVANELKIRNVNIDTLAPRFIGEFQKGIDYIGDIAAFEKELEIHAAIARHFGYKLSIHSGSDKFSIFQLIGKYTQGKFHVKTAGTNWLEAMRVVAAKAPSLYREIHKYALSVFEEAKKYYHVTTDIKRIPDINKLRDDELVLLFAQNDARQLIHITYGFILNAKDEKGVLRFKDSLYRLWRKEDVTYIEMLDKHIGRHLEKLYSGYERVMKKQNGEIL